MVPASDSTGFTQLSSDKTVIAGWFTVSALIAHLVYPQNFDSMLYFVVSQDLPPFVTSTPPQPPYSLFLETPMQTFSTQVPYDATQGAVQDTYLLLQHASDSLYALPQNASFDNSVRNCTLHSLSSSLYSEFRFYRFARRNGTKAVGWTYRTLVSRGLLWWFPLSRRCVCPGCVLNEFLIP